MNMLEALTIVRNCSLRSAQMHTKQGKAALKVIDKKLQSLMRKKAWREGVGAVPIHMADPDFTYPIPDTNEPHPDTALRAKLDDMLGSFKGYSWDSGAGSSGYDEAVNTLLKWLDDRDTARARAGKEAS